MGVAVVAVEGCLVGSREVCLVEEEEEEEGCLAVEGEEGCLVEEEEEGCLVGSREGCLVEEEEVAVLRSTVLDRRLLLGVVAQALEACWLRGAAG